MFEIFYDIPTSGGSSGSPIFDENGKLIAVHFAKQGLNGIGIPVKHLIDVVEHKNTIDYTNTQELQYGQ
ncbi:MAG: trypsin-like peptidase domain-containing protein [Saprospiraceae bacterium]|nr:trypsin-like peptidase domain-containing protein [Saprospiraceae bacterium]